MTIAIGNDHAGTEYKKTIQHRLEELGHKVINHGTDSSDSVDYPDFVHPVADMVANGEAELGVLICGSGNGVSMTANKHQKVRAALCWTAEIAQLAKEHNDANILCLGARVIGPGLAAEVVRTWMTTDFAGGRHLHRIEMFK